MSGSEQKTASMASEGNPKHQDFFDDETSEILTGYPQRRMEISTISEQRQVADRWLLRIVGLTMLVLCLLLLSGHRYHQQRFQSTDSPRSGTVLVTGATGRTGSLLYKELRNRGLTVRAFVRDAEKARAALGCSVCDETEGIYVGDVTDPPSLEHAFADGSVSTLAVAIGASAESSPGVQKAVEFDSLVSSVRALVLSASEKSLKVVFCSSMGTETTPPPKWGGDILHWKLNAEAFLATSGIQSTIVKPCGLPPDMKGKNSTLLVGHLGSITEGSDYHTISREDLASVMAEAVVFRKHFGNLRFDLCSMPGPPTIDLEGLLESARWEWDKQQRFF